METKVAWKPVLICLLLFVPHCVFAQTEKISVRPLSLNEAIGIAHTQSVSALEARNEFISAYWQYRSYKASMLPSMNLYGNVMSFDRSLTLFLLPAEQYLCIQTFLV